MRMIGNAVRHGAAALEPMASCRVKANSRPPGLRLQDAAYLQTCAVAVVLNVVVVVTPPVVYTTDVFAPLASYVTIVVRVAAPLVCVCTQVRVASLYVFAIVVPGKLPAVGRPALSHAV
jgi:hypothetical protein